MRKEMSLAFFVNGAHAKREQDWYYKLCNLLDTSAFLLPNYWTLRWMSKIWTSAKTTDQSHFLTEIVEQFTINCFTMPLTAPRVNFKIIFMCSIIVLLLTLIFSYYSCRASFVNWPAFELFSCFIATYNANWRKCMFITNKLDHLWY